jgi:hypothetical protein
MLLAFPQARISASRAVQHPFFSILAEEEQKNCKVDNYPKHLQFAQENLSEYCWYFKSC